LQKEKKMTKKNVWLGILALALVFGMVVLGSCSSSPKSYSLVDPVAPDDDSAVVYFWGVSSSKAVIWDGETPIGDWGKGPFGGVTIAWKTTPGEHYFMGNASNWVVMKADLEANKKYFVRVLEVPQPLPVTFISMTVYDPNAGEELLKSSKIISFSDQWRAGFAQGKPLKEAQEQLQKAQNDTKMETTLK
jgi:hypothetical protein